MAPPWSKERPSGCVRYLITLTIQSEFRCILDSDALQLPCCIGGEKMALARYFNAPFSWRQVDIPCLAFEPVVVHGLRNPRPHLVYQTKPERKTLKASASQLDLIKKSASWSAASGIYASISRNCIPALFRGSFPGPPARDSLLPRQLHVWTTTNNMGTKSSDWQPCHRAIFQKLGPSRNGLITAEWTSSRPGGLMRSVILQMQTNYILYYQQVTWFRRWN